MMKVIHVIVIVWTSLCWKIDPSLQQDANFPGYDRPDGDALIYREQYDMDTPCRCPQCNASEAGIWNVTHENVAYNKPADASSVYVDEDGSSLDACGVVNGKLSHKYRGQLNYIGSCLHTHTGDNEPWWRVDLRYVYTFQEMIFYRLVHRDGWLGRIRMGTTRVHVDLSLCYQYPEYSGSGFSQAEIPPVHRLRCKAPLTGRFVTFAKPEKGHETVYMYHLQMCELQIWVCKKGTYRSGDGQCQPCPDECKNTCDNWWGCDNPLKHNVAIGKPAAESESSSLNDDSPMTDALFYINVKCFGQNAQSDEKLYWIRVNLETHFKIFYYTIRPFDNYKSIGSPSKFYSTITNQTQVGNFPPPEGIQCNYRDRELPEKIETKLDCNTPKIGRYFTLVRRSVEGFKFCELGVFGHHNYVLKNGATCNDQSQTAVCPTGSVCLQKKCKATAPYPCETDVHCVPQATCREGYCKYGYDADCTVEPESCATGLTCSPDQLKCKRKLNTRCTNNAECLSTDLCDSVLDPSFCKRKREGDCTQTDDCSAGAICQNSRCQCHAPRSEIEGDHCKSTQTGTVSSPCSGNDQCTTTGAECSSATGKCVCSAGKSIYAQDFSCRESANSACASKGDCNTGMLCTGGKCKLEQGRSCYGNEQHCDTDLTCDAEDTICKAQVGGGCQTNADCELRNECSDGTCKIKLNKECTSDADCAAGMICSTEGGSKKCKLTEGTGCSPDAPAEQKPCREGTHCDDIGNVCKIDFGQPCDSDTTCQTGTVCGSTTENSGKKCSIPIGSPGCQADEDCNGTSVCDNRNQCTLAKEAECRSQATLCLAGSTCSEQSGTCQCNAAATDDTDKCSPKAENVGGACGPRVGNETGCQDELALCSVNNTCRCPAKYTASPQNLKCVINTGFNCDRDDAGGDPCTPGTSCKEGICFLKPGQPCRGSKTGYCESGTVCDGDGFCRLKLGHNCSGQPSNCKAGTFCDSRLRCKSKPSAFCRRDDECMAGSVCTELACQCQDSLAVLQDGVCALKTGIVGAPCIGGNGCSDSQATCSSEQVCQCQDDLVPDARMLKCTKKAGAGCRDNSECTSGTTCDPETKQCQIQAGQMCEGEEEENCETGAMCGPDLICRLGKKGNCSGDRLSLCARGFYCDRIGHCTLGVGDSCENQTDACAAGAVCDERSSVCACDPDFSNPYGAVCEPRQGMYGSSCEGTKTCSSPQTECVDGECRCLGGAKPDNRFSCVKTFRQSPRGWVTVYIGIGFGALLVFAVCTILFLLLHRRQSKKREALVKKGSVHMKQLEELKSAVSQMVIDSSLASGVVSSTGGSEFSAADSEFSSAAGSEFSSAAGSEMASTADEEQVLSGTIISGSEST